MRSEFLHTPDLWERLQSGGKTVVLYGMGNGADKIFDVCEKKNIPVFDVFASDGFVRGQIFHGKEVLSWHKVKEKYGKENLAVLLSFGTSRPDVLETIEKIAEEAELLVPDVPVFGEGLFDRSFVVKHEKELDETRELFSDEESKTLFDQILACKLYGRFADLLLAKSDPKTVCETLVQPEKIRCSVDLGAYNGDTVKELLDAGATPEKIFAMEPDPRNFRKLFDYAKKETRTKVIPIQAAAWEKKETVLFDASGNRNASAIGNRSSILAEQKKTSEFLGLPPDEFLSGESVDYMKFDVEGAENEAILGSVDTISRNFPTLLVSLYHKNADLFTLPLKIHELFPAYRGFYLRRFAGVPAWDLNLYVRKEPLS